MKINRRAYDKPRKPYCLATGKQGFPKKKQALTRANIEQALKGDILSVYKCPFCGEWHMTSKIQFGGRQP